MVFEIGLIKTISYPCQCSHIIIGHRYRVLSECFGIDAKYIVKSDEILSAEEGIGKRKAQSGRNETAAILHHPCVCFEVDRRHLAPCVQHRSTWSIYQNNGKFV